jgi:polar amino acid transport system substrate-binding protein
MVEVLAFRMSNVPHHKEVAVRRTALMLVQTLALGIAVGVLGPHSVSGQQGSDPRVTDLIQAGKIRVGLGLVPTFATKDPATGEVRGVAMELAHALAARLGIAVVPVEYPSPPSVLDGLKTGAWDVGFLGIDPARLAQADFSPPYLQVDSTYLVPAGSAIRTSADADHPGVRIVVTRNSVEDFALTRMLKQAALVHVETISAGFDVVRAGNADVLAVPRPTALQFATRWPGSRVLEDRFHTVFHGIAVPKGQAGRLAYVSDFIEEAKASGLVQQAVERAGLRGVQVAPPGNPSPQ